MNAFGPNIMRAALERIANPIQAMEADAKEEGGKVHGPTAVSLSNNPHYLREIARKALLAADGPDPL